MSTSYTEDYIMMKAIEKHANCMSIICLNCSRRYGDHHGLDCPDGIHRFRYKIDNLKDNDPNIIFRGRMGI